MNRRLRICCSLSVLVFSASFTAASPGDLQGRIASARAGDTVFIPAGTYRGNILVNKRLALIGIDRPVIAGEGNESVITLTADSCVVKGLVVEHCGTMLVNEDAGVLLKSNGNLVEDNTLRDVLFGIYLLHSGGNIIRDNTITGRPWLELGERGSGIHIWNADHNLLQGNSITDVRDGLYMQNAHHSCIEGNEAFRIRYGLHYMFADSNVFLNNSFHDNVAGAAIMYSRGISMRHNVFSHNRGFASFGILFQDCHGLRADSNVVSDNVVGLFFEASTDNRFSRNIIAQNDLALEMFQNSIHNTFSENNFIDNLSPLTVIGKRTGTSWDEAGRGNYWSQYGGYDLDGDGIGDVAFKIQNVFGYLEGRNSNVRLYLDSPAARALAVAAGTFPILDVGSEIDAKPLMRPVDLHRMPAVTMMATLTHPARTARAVHAWMALPLFSVTVLLVWVRLSARRPMR